MSLKGLLKDGEKYGFARNQKFDKAEGVALTAENIESVLAKVKIPDSPSVPIEFISSKTYEKRQRGECDYCEKPTHKGSNWCEYHYTEICKGLKEYFWL
jgi:hypothetical protein